LSAAPVAGRIPARWLDRCRTIECTTCPKTRSNSKTPGEGLRAGDEHMIARQMLAIDALGRRHGIRVVFVVPPAYETNRDGSIVNEIFNRGLALVQNLS